MEELSFLQQKSYTANFRESSDGKVLFTVDNAAVSEREVKEEVRQRGWRVVNIRPIDAGLSEFVVMER